VPGVQGKEEAKGDAMRRIIGIFVFCFCMLCAASGSAADITVHYNAKGKIVNTHYNAPGEKSPNVIITVDLLFGDGRYVKCVDTYLSGGALLGFGRITSPNSIEFVPKDDVQCITVRP
jgi:hypothetical protein